METDIFAIANDIFRYEESSASGSTTDVKALQATAEPVVPKAPSQPLPMPKVVKPPKPVPPVLSKQNPLGFHESTIKRALETWQPKGEPQQLLKHLGKHQGAMQEAELTGLHGFLSGKPSVSREDVLNHLESQPHQVQMKEHDEASGPGKWHVHADGDATGDAYDDEDEAARAATDLNQDHKNEYRDQFEIEGEDPHYTVDTSALEALEDKEKELGGEIGMEASRALKRLGRTKFDSENEAKGAIGDYLIEHLPNTYGSREANDTINQSVEENAGTYRVSSSPLSRQRHAANFGDAYDSEDEAQEAIDNYIDENWEPPYSYSQAEGGNMDSVPEEYRWLPGPQENYNETHVAVDGLPGPQRPLPTADQFRVTEVNNSPSLGQKSLHIHDDTGLRGVIPLRGEDAEKVFNEWLAHTIESTKDFNRQTKGIDWHDGHEQYSHIDNPVVRIRHDDRETADGKNMFFVEEFQGPGDSNQAKMPPWLQSRIYDVGLKRALMKAVQGGYDRLGWTTGNQQADRYSLRKQVDRIEWLPTSPMHEGVQSGRLVGIKDGKEVTNKSLVNSELPEYVGKEVAAKLLANHIQGEIKPGSVDRFMIGEPERLVFKVHDGNGKEIARFMDEAEAKKYLESHQDELAIRTPGLHFVEGPDLELGGRGLKQTYDVDLHRRLLEIKIGDKKLKNLGVKIGKSEVPNGSYDLIDDGVVVGNYDTPLHAAHEKDKLGRGYVEKGTDTVHSIDIPPELAAEIKRHGVSLYSKRPSSPGSDGPLQFSRDRLLDIVRRMPASEAVVYAAGVLRLLDLRPMLMREYSTEEIAYLRGIVQQFGGK